MEGVEWCGGWGDTYADIVLAVFFLKVHVASGRSSSSHFDWLSQDVLLLLRLALVSLVSMKIIKINLDETWEFER